MKTTLNYYLILKVPQTAKQKEIREAYLNLVRRYHPDKNKGNKLAEKKFQQINTAYQILQDPEKRKAFDTEWQIFQQRLEEQKKRRPIKPSKKERPSPLKKESAFFKYIKSFFQERREEKPIDLEIPLFVSLKDLCQSSLKKVVYFKPYNGRQKKESIKITIPEGSRPGVRLQFKGKGGSHGKQISGNLFLKIDFPPHPFFKIKDYDIHLTFPIKFTEAFKGSKKEIFSPYGTVFLVIPPKVKHNHIFRLKNLGLPKDSKSKGHLFVKLFVDYPKEKRIKIQNEMKNLSEKDKKSYIDKYELQKNIYEKVLDFEKNPKA